MSSYKKNKKAILRRLRRVEGQLRGLQKMVESDEYCIDLLTQISSVMAATKKIGLIILKDHVSGCVKDSLEKGKGKEKIDEMIMTVERFIKI